MKREIKFRAFHKGKMTEDIPVYKNQWYVMTHPNNAPMEMQFVDDAEIMQYTGLKDKNGKEMFEGDVFQTPSNNSSEMLIGQILWDVYEAKFEYCVKFKSGGATLGTLGHYLSTTNTDDRIEIIGNIHENPELT